VTQTVLEGFPVWDVWFGQFEFATLNESGGAERGALSMRMNLFSCSFGVLLSVALQPNRCFAEDPSKLSQELTRAGIKIGVTLTKQLVKENDISWSPGAYSTPTDQKVALESAINEYQSFKAEYQGQMALGKGSAEFFIDVTAASAAATGVGAVPAIILKGVAQTAADQFFEGEQKRINEDMTAYLAMQRDKLTSISGASYEQLRGLPPDQIKAKLAPTPVFADVRNVAGDDPAVKETAESLFIAAIKNTSMATLDSLAGQAQRLDHAEERVQALATSVAKFQKSTSATLDAHAQAIGSLREEVGQLGSSITSINKRLTSMGRDQAVIADFVFERMDPKVKASALRAGFLADRFACADGGSECDPAKLKKDLITRFDQEAQINALVDGARSTAVALSNVATIAQNVGLTIPELDTAVQLGTVASNAFSDIASGNYLGAVAAITGLFGARVNPEAERFKLLMSYQKQEFAKINGKLDLIIQNQKTLLDAINGLAQQMANFEQALDEHLVRMEFELKRVSEAARGMNSDKWKSCYSLWNNVQKAPNYGYHQRGDFATLSDIAEAAATNVTLLRLCHSTALAELPSISETRWFGNFLNASAAVQFTPDPFPPEDTGKYYNQDDLKNFIDNIHKPSLWVMGFYASRSRLPWARVLDLLASPSPTVHGLRAKLAKKYDPEAPCTTAGGSPGYLSTDRLQGLLCTQLNRADRAAWYLLSQPMVVDNAIDLADWMLLLSRLSSVYDEQEQRSLNIAEILLAAQEPGHLASGRNVVRDARMMLDAATASFGLIYGDLMAEAIVDLLKSKPETAQTADRNAKLLALAKIQVKVTTKGPPPNASKPKPAIADNIEHEDLVNDLERLEDAKRLLRANPYLARNVALLMMRDHYGLGNNDGTFRHVPPRAITYRTAYDFAVASPENPGFLLSGLFDINLDFSLGTDGTLQLTLADNTDPSKRIFAKVPTPEMFVAGQLVYPPRMLNLLRQRERVGERLAEYDVLSGLPEDQQRALVSAVARKDQ
jgi:hypothetical protein